MLGLVICVSDIIQKGSMLGLVICVSAIIQNEKTCRDSWSVYLTLYRMASMFGLVICIWHYTEWWWDLWSVYLTFYRMDTTLDSWICVSDIIQNGFMFGLVILYLTLYRMTPMFGLVICVSDIIHDDAMFGLMICVSDILQNDGHEITSPTLHHPVLCQIHRSRVPTWRHSVKISDTQITSPNMGIILYNVRCTDHESQHGVIL